MESTTPASNESLFELQIDQQSIQYLSETARWARFLSIMGFIFCGLMVFLGIFAGALMSSFQRAGAVDDVGGGMMSFMRAGLSFVYIGFALLYFFPCLYLFNFAGKMQLALRNNDQHTLNASFGQLKSCFKFVGILTIVVLGLYLLIFIGGITAGLLMR